MPTATKAAPKKRDQVSQQSIYEWTAKDKRGKVMKGEMPARDAITVKARLRQQGMNPQQVREKPKPLFGSAGSKVKTQDIAVFSRQISTMMASGVPMVQAFEIIAGGQKNVRFKNMLNDIKNRIEGGASLNEALGAYPLHFDELYRNLVQAGEAAGVLDTVLDTVATYKERLESTKSKIKKALFYPVMVLVVAFIVAMILLLFVVPVFQGVFANAGAALPAPTMVVVNASKFMKSYWWAVIGSIVGAVVLLFQANKRSVKFAHFLDRFLLKIPVIGEILRKSALSRFARTLGVTFRAGVPLVEALDAVAGATGSIVYNNATKQIREDVAVGHNMALAMVQTGVFPNMVVQMVSIGEESGALDSMLFKVAEFYEEEVEAAVDTLSTLLEPFIMVILGVMVGGMVISLYLPIFKLAGTF